MSAMPTFMVGFEEMKTQITLLCPKIADLHKHTAYTA